MGKSKKKIIIHLNNGERLIYYYDHSQFEVKTVDETLNITISEKESVHIPLKSILYYEFKTIDVNFFEDKPI